MRNKLNKRRDMKVFKRTVNKRHKKNFASSPRGGICF